MIVVWFSGWFQCRLATDPDPFDEPRGVAGYVHAYVGEPDLDRTIYFQRPPFVRSLAPNVGVKVDFVEIAGQNQSDHPLLGAHVDLLREPKFEGRNGVIADAGLEPVYPFVMRISTDEFSIERAVQPVDPTFPFEDLFARGVEDGTDEVRVATGIPDLVQVWRARTETLEAELRLLNEPARTGQRERITFLKSQLDRPGGGTARFFSALMRYKYLLQTPPRVEGDISALPVLTSTPWPVRFWLGGWDADTLCGFVKGTLSLTGERADDGEISGISVVDRRP